MAERATRSLVKELLRSYRFTLVTLTATLVLSLLSSGYLLLVAQPRVEDYVKMGFQARMLQVGMLEQETGLRGYLASGDEEFLEPYASGRVRSEGAEAALLEIINDEGADGLATAILSVLVPRAEWVEWAQKAAVRDPSPGQGLTEFLRKGRDLFNIYQVADDASTALIVSRRQQAVDNQRVALVAVLLGYLLLLVGAAGLAIRRRRELHASLVAPMDRMLRTIGAFHDGDLTARAEPSGVREIDAVGEALGELADGLGRATAEAVTRESRLSFLATRFELVIRVAREVSGSLSVRYVSATVTAAAADLLGAPATLWVRGEGQQFVVTSRSTDPHGAAPRADLVAPPVVAVAAADIRPVTVEDARAYPLVLAGEVVGVLHVAVIDVDADSEQVLEALLSTASAALESARLHSTARELAHVDGLTQLPNRRKFEADIDEEWQRCRRYGRPLSLVMLDLDHFKALNDTHGHLFGDEVLRATSAAIGSVLRVSDTAYRYGGEEFVVLLRETGLGDAHQAAERIRQAVSEVTLPKTGVLVTASAGVAERVAAMAHHTEMVMKADSALYQAKRAGRDQVVSADPVR